MKPRTIFISLFNIDFGIRHISSLLRSKGYSTDIISFKRLRLKAEIFCSNYLSPKPLRQKACPDKDAELLINLLSELKPDIIGISVPSTSFITASILTQKIKEALNIPVVWGGIHPTLCPEGCIEHADIVCIGEGEYPILELAQRLENKEEITGIKNLWIKKEDGSIEKNDLRNLIQDLDSLPYPDFVYSGNKFLIDESRIIPQPPIFSCYTNYEYPIMSSRGCHFSCSFCCNSVLKFIYGNKGSYVRRRSPDSIVDELIYVRKNRELFRIRFHDDIFTYDQDWIEKFCRLYAEKIALPFTCYAHPKFTDKGIIQMLANAGLTSVDLGIQSGSESFCRDKFKREQSNEEIIEFANLLKELEIVPRYNLITDNPYEEDSDSDATAELLMRLPRPYLAGLYSLCYFPKIELTNQALKDGLITEGQVEGRDNKALNNFYMCIDLAKDKKRLFWDTILAMIVSDFFSEKFIRNIKDSRFMRHHPKLLLFLLRLYLKISIISPREIIKPINIFKEEKKWEDIYRAKNLFIKNPIFFLSLAKLYLKINIFGKGKIFTLCNSIVNTFDKFTIDTPHQVFEDKTKIELLIAPENSSDETKKRFSLTIRKKKNPQFSSPLKLWVDIRPLKSIFLSREIRFGLWEMDFEIDNNEAEIKLDLQFPQLFFTLKGIHQEANMRSKKEITEKGLYMVSFGLYDKLLKRATIKNCSVVHL